MKIVTCLAVLAALVAVCCVSYVGIFRWIFGWNDFDFTDIYEGDDMDSAVVFQLYDKNGDGYLSFEEFQPVAKRLNFVNETFTYNDTIEVWDQVITLQSFFQPLLISTMRKDMESPGSVVSLNGLESWRSPFKRWKNFGASAFQIFLPDASVDNVLCEPYYIVQPLKTMFGTVSLSSKRFYSPKLEDKAEIFLHRLLSVFHPRPFIQPRFAPQGSVACVRAFNDKFLDVVFRVHAEFQLNEPPLHPFWFTPAQFTGHLVIDRAATTVEKFHFFVPTHQRLNVDMEWLQGPSELDMEVDIGYMPQMELLSTRSSVPAFFNGHDQRETFHQSETEKATDITWNQEMTFEEAASILELKMYPFKQVRYYNFTDVFKLAEKEVKPVHSILLWGALDDQSC